MSTDISILPLPTLDGRTLRFVFEHAGTLRLLAWMNVGSDGSLYFNPRRPGTSSHHVGSAIADGEGGWLDEVWSEIDPVGPNPKVSYHASGYVKAPGDVTRSWSPREVSEPRLIRQDYYAHPSTFDVLSSPPRQTDILVPDAGGGPFAIDEARPLQSRTWVAPLVDGNAQVMEIENQASQSAIIVPAVDLDDCQDVTYQVTFFNGPPGEWPGMSIVAVENLDG